MGPHSFKCGKIEPNLSFWTGPNRFNGAALFQVRKATTAAASRMWGATLQWGRTLSSAESLLVKRLPSGCVPLQWGRTLSSAESEPANINPDAELVLQWGRTLSSAERQAKRDGRATNRAASMGPHSFKCGKSAKLAPADALQISFNGAALFQVRKVLDILASLWRALPLQWGRTLSSAERETGRQIKSGGESLQWGRTLSSAESLFAPLSIQNSQSFNGAALFQVRKALTLN